MRRNGGYTRKATTMDNPVTRKANSVCIHPTHLNRSTILLSRFSLAKIVHAGMPPKGVNSLTLFPFLPYHPPHVPQPNYYLHYQHYGGCLGGIPR